MPIKYFLLAIFLLFARISSGQSASVWYDTEYYHQLEKLEALSGKLSNELHSGIKPFERKHIGEFLMSVQKDIPEGSFPKATFDYLVQDNWAFTNADSLAVKEGFRKYIFSQKSDVFSVKNEDYSIHASPIVNFGGGVEKIGETTYGQFVNTRGVVVSGTINKKLGFYTHFTENQDSSPAYLSSFYNYYDGWPHLGFTKVKEDSSTGQLKRDYMRAQGYLCFYPSKNVKIQFGQSSQFIGHGIRSLIISDLSPAFLNFKAEVRMGRLQYMNMWAQLSNRQVNVGVDNLRAIPAKFMVFHHLNVNVAKNINVGIFENIYLGNRGFDINYLNPIIFYRFVEGFIGSADNAMVGADFKFNFLKRATVYGQVVIDEFSTSEVTDKGWYGQKNAGQLGFKVYNIYQPLHIDLQGELNYVRPYTFSHFTSYSSGLNYNVPVGHPFGANFKELLLIARANPMKNLFVKASYLNNLKGYDDLSNNWGGNIEKNYRFDRPREYGNVIAQGLKGRTESITLEMAYQLWHNVFLDLTYMHRTFSATDNQTSNLFLGGIRWNLPKPGLLF